ncbi:GNAT family N-acetyltransferase [Dethiothermospora halolimnae]|uniref:GNAT family N-acetyltransferase n=1 Tax=Dethiothermospora halolimnae TaxID=3114390 RepID=UPI003CCC37C5
MENIKIVEYDKSHAKELAKMWNMSGDNWGGMDAVQTEETIIQENEGSGNLKAYVALDGEEVAGFCSFSEYQQDEGASYIPLLNVRPDYHGKKVGKKLVLEVIKDAVKSPWPRLDLYTWPGNTKAVPLYKKCGFFWEKRDDATHLMNFIPAVLKNEIVKGYFDNYFDWYKDSKREIEVKPDGTEEHDYCDYRYIWEKNDRILKLEFERKGRNLKFIETEDYLINMNIPSSQLVFGKTYKVKYHILNKSGKDLNISIKGLDDKNIKSDFNIKLNVSSERTIEAEFYVGEIEEEQNTWRTHPCVKSEIHVNGETAIFGLGIEPKFPVKVKLVVPNKPAYRDIKSKCYLDIENSFDEDAVFNFSLQDTENISFMNKDYEIKLKGKERKSIRLEYILTNHCFYESNIAIDIKLKDSKITFNKKISAIFKGNIGKLMGETEEKWIVSNGKYTLSLDKFENDLILTDFSKNIFETIGLYPKIGKPYSLEFSKIRPINVNFYEEGEGVVLEATYRSRDFKGIQLVLIAKLYLNGVVEYYYEIHNLENEVTKGDIYLSQGIYHNLSHSFIPYKDKIVEISGTNSSMLDYWNSNAVTENWTFSEGENITRGIAWPKEYEVNFNGWYISADNNFGKLKEKEIIKTKKMYIAWNTFNSWRAFRDFVIKNHSSRKLISVDKIDFEVNNGNPFINGNFDVRIKDYREVDFDGQIEVSSSNNFFDTKSREINKKDSIREIEFNLNTSTIGLDTIDLKANLDSMEVKSKKSIFNIGSRKIKKKMTKEQGMDVYILDNGLIKLKSAPEFASSVFSLTYNDKEWLDSSFPTPRPKSWWNPWTGGITCMPDEKFTNTSMLEEKSSCQFVEKIDNHNNRWEGIKITLDIQKHKKYKGLKINQFFMVLPELPILCHTVELEQDTGVYFDSVEFICENYFKIGEELKESWFRVKDRKGDFIKYKGGRKQDVLSSNSMIYGSEDLNDKLQLIYTGEDTLCGFSNPEALGNLVINNADIEHGDSMFIPPTFMIFTEEYIEEKLLKDLKNIKF